MRFLRSIAIWLIFIIIASLNGTIRTLWLVPSEQSVGTSNFICGWIAVASGIWIDRNQLLKESQSGTSGDNAEI